MKTPIFFLLLCAGALRAQTVTVYNRYFLYPEDSLSKSRVYFDGRTVPVFSTDDFKLQLDLAARRILAKTSKGDSVCSVEYFASTNNLFDDGSLTNYADWTPDQFSQPANAAKPLTKWQRYDFFRKNGSGAKNTYLDLTADRRFIFGYDTIVAPGKKTKQKFSLKPDYVLPERVADYFSEAWNFDPVAGRFSKDLVYYGYFNAIDRDGKRIGYHPLICFEQAATVLGKDVLLKKNVVCDVSVTSVETQLFNDTTYRVPGDVVAELENRIYGFLPLAERNRFIGALLYYALHNPSKVFPVNDAKVDSLHPFKTVFDVENLFTRWDSTNIVDDPNNPGIYVMAPLKRETYTSDVYAIRFYEDWYYDAETFTLKKKVNGIGLLLNQPTDYPITLQLHDAGIYIKVN